MSVSSSFCSKIM
jgi:hypothetical protein